MSLREQIAARLHDVISKARQVEARTEHPTSRSIFDVGIQAAADEVIRQMEWARSPYRPVGKEIEWGDYSESKQWWPLDLAPPDWQP